MLSAARLKLTDDESLATFEMDLSAQIWQVKYIGSEVATGLWGIKYTRRPVEILVKVAKSLPVDEALPQCNLKVSTEGVSIDILTPESKARSWKHPIDTISYGVQDLVYTRVFAMIVVKDEQHPHPFEVHAFVCDSRAVTRKLTFALAAAFQDYSRRIKESGEQSKTDNITPQRQKFAIDLRTPEELQEGANEETEA
ncbi:uncharacterized protein [Eurosta solidaginis]|uniref:uncharacterized protein isoform X2 n=1 Tax=Eurosta solidaginis TaxID=178769 RepID=UPI00353061F1